MVITDLQTGDKGIITNMSLIEKSFRHRLMDMGIYPECHITLIRILAKGNLYLVEVDDVEICIRKEDADRIEVSI